jgi:LDH2 family malate/lactate/ureidoglycolate dehydrogenase
VPTEAAGRVRLGVAQARALAERALAGAGCDTTQAQVLADHMIDAALCGYEYSGLPKILNVAEYLALHPPLGPLQVQRETPMSTLLDGMGHNGMFTVLRATELALAKAREHGFGLVGVSNTWMSGRGAYFMERLAREGLIGLLAISSRPQVAPPGAAKAAIGTNPVSFGFPTEGDPLLIDLGTSSLMFTDLALRARRGEPLPEGTAIDAQGRPTTDPQAALHGAVLSFGGHKGFALALAMKALGVLAGAGHDRDGAGYLVLALQPELMMPLAEYRRELSQALAAIRATPRQPGVDAIRIPSDRSHAQRRENLVAGLVIDRQVHESLLRLAAAAPAH